MIAASSVFLSCPQAVNRTYGVLYGPVGPEPIAFSGSMTNDREEAESTHVVVGSTTKSLVPFVRACTVS